MVGERCPWCLGDEPPANSLTSQSPSVFLLEPIRARTPPIFKSRAKRRNGRGIFVMNIELKHIDALQSLGYTESEARFLYIVATHSGYFVARQFLAFTASHWGKRTTTFWSKLHTKKHARTECFPLSGTVYHLFSRRLYRQIDRENIRNRREHEIEFIQ